MVDTLLTCGETLHALLHLTYLPTLYKLLRIPYIKDIKHSTKYWRHIGCFKKKNLKHPTQLSKNGKKKGVFQSHLKNLWKTRCLDLFFPRKLRSWRDFFSCREECNTDVHHCTMWPRIFQKLLCILWIYGVGDRDSKIEKYFSKLVLNIWKYNSYTNKSKQNMLPLCVCVCH